MGVKILLVHPHGHDDFLERRVARSLTQAVDGALDLRRAVADGLERKGCGHAQVVMSVDRNRDVLDTGHALAQVTNTGAKLPGHVVARGIGNIHDRGAGLDRSLDNANEEFLVRATSILGIELNVVDKLASMLHRMDGTLNSLILGHMELIAQVAGTHTKTGVDTGPLGRFEGFCGHLDVPIHRAGEAAYRATVDRDLADLLYRAKISGARNGKARLDNVHVHAYELTRDDELFLGIHAGAGRLLSVAQGGVKDCDFAAHDFLLIGLRYRWLSGEMECPKIEKYPCRSSRPKAADDSAPGYNLSL